MADVMDRPNDKKAEKARKKAEKEERKRLRAEQGELEGEGEITTGGKIATFFVTLIIILLWLAIIVLLVKWDVGGFGSQVLGPVFKDVPYVNKILPDSVFEADNAEEDPYAYATIDEAIEKIKELETALADAQTVSDADADYIRELEEKASQLEAYKRAEAEFESEKQKWYEEVVFSNEAPDIVNYKEFYESIEPAIAEMLYKQVVQQTAYSDKVEEYVKTYSTMKPKEAAAIFDAMTDNLQLVADILKNMDAQSRADILGKMSSDTAAKVTKIMKP